MKTYSEKLKDPRWQRKRLEVMERDGFECSQCGDSGTTLAVHHTYYITGRNPWEYPIWSLQTLCENCHKDNHSDKESDGTLQEWEEIIGFLGINKMEEFVSWWDISTMIAMRKEQFAKRGIRSIDWMMWAVEAQDRIDYLSKLPPWDCAACKDPFPRDFLSPIHTCGKDGLT